MKPLQKSSESSQPILSVADFHQIFAGVEELLEVHENFMSQLEPRVENWNDKQLIGDLFTIIVSF